jgi:hypothetical protein
MAVKIFKKGKDKNYLATCQKCNTDFTYTGKDIGGGESGANLYVDCPECDETVMHDSYNSNRYMRVVEKKDV